MEEIILQSPALQAVFTPPLALTDKEEKIYRKNFYLPGAEGDIIRKSAIYIDDYWIGVFTKEKWIKAQVYGLSTSRQGASTFSSFFIFSDDLVWQERSLDSIHKLISIIKKQHEYVLYDEFNDEWKRQQQEKIDNGWLDEDDD